MPVPPRQLITRQTLPQNQKVSLEKIETISQESRREFDLLLASKFLFRPTYLFSIFVLITVPITLPSVSAHFLRHDEKLRATGSG